jgi:hypothetical protein
MDDANAKELGLEALAVGFEWAPGCLAGGGARLVSGDSVACEVYRRRGSQRRLAHWTGHTLSKQWPDFRDPATLGVLLASVRERSGALLSPVATVGLDSSPGWTLDHPESPMVDALDIGYHATEAHALVAALKAAKEV